MHKGGDPFKSGPISLGPDLDPAGSRSPYISSLLLLFWFFFSQSPFRTAILKERLLTFPSIVFLEGSPK